MLTYIGIGAAIGILTGIPIGPVNVAVIDAAYRHAFIRAIAVGLGGAVGDLLYAALGILGLGPILEKYPHIPPILYGISGIVLIVYGSITVRAQPARAVPAHEQENVKQTTDGQHVLAGFVLGVALILLNPAAIVTWVLIVGSFMSGATTMEGLGAVIGVGLGSFCWFTFVAWLADHGKRVLGDKAIWITRVVGALLVGYGFYALGRAGFYVYKHFNWPSLPFLSG